MKRMSMLLALLTLAAVAQSQEAAPSRPWQCAALSGDELDQCIAKQTETRNNASFASWLKCADTITDNFNRGMEMLSIQYPRFGIAYHAMSEEIKAATTANGVDQAAITESRRRFDDRILGTAETEALEYYNLFKLKFQQSLKQCGPMPEPPRLVK